VVTPFVRSQTGPDRFLAFIGKRNAQTDLKTSLNDVLREYDIGS